MLKKIEWLALSLVTLVVLFFALNWAVQAAVHSQRDVTVPDLSGKPLLEALNILSKMNLGMKQDGAENNASVPIGTVLRQQPPAGMAVREGKIIRVTLSQGGESIFTPDLVGQSLRSAEIALRLNGVSLGEVQSRPSIKFEKDVVLSQDPKSKTIIGKNSMVHLTVSDGPPKDGSILMPDFAGKTLNDVNAWAKDLNITVESTVEESPQENDVVLRQSVLYDEIIQKGSSLNVAISRKLQSAPPSINPDSKAP